MLSVPRPAVSLCSKENSAVLINYPTIEEREQLARSVGCEALMKQILQNLKNGSIEIADIPVPALGSGEVLIRTARSLISTGTEKMLLEFGKASYLNKVLQQPEKAAQVINKMKTDGVAATLEAVEGSWPHHCLLGIAMSVVSSRLVTRFPISSLVIE